MDIKPTNMNELTEVITSATFHPIDCHNFVYSSSKGVVYMGTFPTLSVLLSPIPYDIYLLFIYLYIHTGDMRSQSLCDKSVRCKSIRPSISTCFINTNNDVLSSPFAGFRENEGVNKSFFSEVTSSISDLQFSKDGRYILARDYLHLKIWDVNMDCKLSISIYLRAYSLNWLFIVYLSSVLPIYSILSSPFLSICS